MENYKMYYIIAAAMFIYLSFAFGMLLLKNRIGKAKSMKFVIITPIALSFLTGVTLLIIALTSVK